MWNKNFVNGEKDASWKWKDFQLPMAHDLDLASLIDICLHAKFNWSQKLFADGWTDIRTYIWPIKINFIRSTQSRPKKTMPLPTLGWQRHKKPKQHYDGLTLLVGRQGRHLTCKNCSNYLSLNGPFQWRVPPEKEHWQMPSHFLMLQYAGVT